ncbi:unnamed protein product [Nezara viridula]|uniref:ZP domain-containing protein n=1 Tax=Nezara viridula TaxID=85310 RepID=A0A9P0HGS7_NEZVI|nr:unnamed protein product [Nezara viridula]
MSSAVRQAVDPVVQVKCHLHEDMLPIKPKSSRRSGRKLNDGGRAWLEVRGSAISAFNGANILTVGEHTVLSVHTKLPDGITGMPVDCRVEDGHGSSQSLTDARGCPTEPSLVPALHPAKSPGTWVTAFPAFSFPDSSLVHYICLLMLCTGECPQYTCMDDENGSRNSRNFQDDSEENILDYVELYNNVEVTAPNIELGYLKKDMSDILSGMYLCL